MGVKTQISQLKAGSVLSETQYYEVLGVDHHNERVLVVNERGKEMQIGFTIIEEGTYSAEQFTETVELNRTDLIKKFTECGDTIFTVNYHKKPDIKDINAAIDSLNDGKILPIKKMKEIIANVYKGEERTLTGYSMSTETGFGRSKVIDMTIKYKPSDKGYDNRIREVDHRTLNYLIYKNVKYVCTSK